MRAAIFNGPFNVVVGDVPDPQLKDPGDVIIRVTLSAICGSDLHPYTGRLPIPLKGWVMGHEYAGVVVETGPDVHRFRQGDRVVGSFMAACGECEDCKRGWPTQCLRQEHFGFAQVAGTQAEYLRVPFADQTLESIPQSLSDEQAILVGDVLATGYFAVDWAGIQPGDVVTVVGCGAVGLLTIMSARLFQPEAIIALDSVPERLTIAEKLGAAAINISSEKAANAVRKLTGNRGADAVIEAVGTPDAIAASFDYVRPGGTICVVGVPTEPQMPVPGFRSFLHDITLRVGLCPAQRYLGELLSLIEAGRLDPTQVITHRLPLSEAPHGYDIFANQKDGCVKVVLKP